MRNCVLELVCKWRDGRNGTIAPILKIGTGDEPVVGSYPALSAIEDANSNRTYKSIVVVRLHLSELFTMK